MSRSRFKTNILPLPLGEGTRLMTFETASQWIEVVAVFETAVQSALRGK
jgi:hypothetical protein